MTCSAWTDHKLPGYTSALLTSISAFFASHVIEKECVLSRCPCSFPFTINIVSDTVVFADSFFKAFRNHRQQRLADSQMILELNRLVRDNCVVSESTLELELPPDVTSSPSENINDALDGPQHIDTPTVTFAVVNTNVQHEGNTQPEAVFSGSFPDKPVNEDKPTLPSETLPSVTVPTEVYGGADTEATTDVHGEGVEVSGK